MRSASHVPALTLGVLATLAAWIYTIRNADGMAATMPMPGGWGMSMVWMIMNGQSPVAHAVMFVGMWTVMMVAMMLPSVLPAVVLHQRLVASRVERGIMASGSHVWLLAGYFSIWALFGLMAYTIGMAVSAAAMRHVRVSGVVPLATGATLIAAGGYQLTRWKHQCLRHCRSPLDFFARHDVRCATDSWRFGLHHGAYCAGCCWGLMAIQLAIGVMSVPLMLVISLIILLEKRWRHGEMLARIAGITAIAAGAFLALQATIRA